MINVYECEKETEISHNGMGTLRKVRAHHANDFSTNIDFIDYIEVPPGVSIGTHQHGYNEEIYFIVEGNGTMLIEDEKYNVKSGDVIVNKINGTHGLMNHSSADMKIFIIQVKQ